MRRFSLQVNPIGFVRKKSEPNVGQYPSNQHTPKQGSSQQYLSSQASGRPSAVAGTSRTNRGSSPTSRGPHLRSGDGETVPVASSTPASPRHSGATHRDSSPASSGGGAGGAATGPAKNAAMIVSSAGSWYDDMPSGSGGEGADEVDGAGSGGANDSRSSGGGSADWPSSFLDGATSSDIQKLRLMNKIEHIKDKLVAANKTKEADVDEFLRLTSNAPVTVDNPQMIRIRQVFEKKNKKSAHTIVILQKKLDSYQQKLRDVELGTANTGSVGAARKPKTDNVLTNVGQGLNGVFENIKEGLSGLSSVSQNAAGSVIAVPKDLAHRLLKKSDSADNIHNSNPNLHTSPLVPATVVTSTATSGGSTRGPLETIGRGDGDGVLPNSAGRVDDGRRVAGSPRSARAAPTAVFYTDPEKRDRTKDSINADAASRLSHRSVSPPYVPPSGSDSTGQRYQETPRRAPVQSPRATAAQYEQQQAQYDQLSQEMQAVKRSNDQMAESVNELRSKIQQEYAYFHATVHELTFRVQRMEDQLNDQAELHSAEVNGVRGDLQTVEARVSYQMSQIDGDLKDVIGRVTTRVEALEHRVKDQFGVDQNAVGTLAVRASYLLAQTFLTIVFLLTQGLLPFMKTRARSVTTVVVVIIAVIFFRNLDVFEEWTLRFSRRA